MDETKGYPYIVFYDKQEVKSINGETKWITVDRRAYLCNSGNMHKVYESSAWFESLGGREENTKNAYGLLHNVSYRPDFKQRIIRDYRPNTSENCEAMEQYCDWPQTA